MTEKRRLATTLRLEALETREMPTATPALPATGVRRETFDQTAIGELPADWAQWDSQASFQVLPGRAQAGAPGLVASGSSGEAARAWLAARQAANIQVSATLRLDSLIPAEILLRGNGLNTTSPTYYDLTLTRGLNLQLYRVVDGNRTYLGSVQSNDYLSGPWVRVIFQADGNTLRAMVYRQDTHRYLDASGHWQARPTWALVRHDSAIGGSGFVGLGREAGYAGDTVFNDFHVFALSRGVPSATASYGQQFAGVPLGGLPSGWMQWSNQAPAAVTADHALSGSKGLRFDAGSGNNARAWVSDVLPADVQVTASTFLNNLIPAELFVRGHGLDSATPTYYAVTATRGLNLQLWKIVNGVRTSLGVVRSSDYLSGVWLKISLDASGSTLRVRVQRLDSGNYLNSSGHWQRGSTWAMVRQENSISGPGKVGLGRESSYSGATTFDNFEIVAANTTPTPNATLSRLADSAVISAPVVVEAKVDQTTGARRVEFFVDGRQTATDAGSPFQWTLNPGTLSAGPHQLTVRVIDRAGNITTLERDFTVSRVPTPAGGSGGPITPPPPSSAIPSHYSWIRLAELAYFGMNFGPLERQLLRNSVDLVIPDVRFLNQINALAPNTPQLLYTNATSIYQESLLDWLNYADAHGISREDAFYHAAVPTPFSGQSPSSQPVNWFWGVYLSKAGNLLDFTGQAHSGEHKLLFGGLGESLYIGYSDAFREINFDLIKGAGRGWSGVLEYATSVDADGRPTAWAPLRTLTDTTDGFKRSGQITFDPPRDWKTSIASGMNRLFYVRIRTTSGGIPPIARTILGRDYVNARDGQSGTIPVFDASADLDHDGYLNDMEYAHRTAGMNARFAYESRVFLGFYGQMRPATNPSNPNFLAWLIDYEQRFLSAHHGADGLFLDNSGGKTPVADGTVLENTLNYSSDYAKLVNALSKALAPRLVLINTSNGDESTNAIVGGASAYFEEFALRPMSGTFQQFEDLANAVATRQNSHGSRPPYAILDSLPIGGSPTSPRTQLATLAEYYLLADPKYTFLDFFGGFEPSTQWSRHFTPAVNFNVGQPRGDWKLFPSGRDPSDRRQIYHVYSRDYDNALVLYRPLSYSASQGTRGSLGDNSASTLQLNGRYRPLHADGTLGPEVTSISLRNGEGAILVRA
jgi:hypothetical protein